MIQKIRLDFVPSVNLGPIIVDIITKKEKGNKTDVPAETELAMPEFHTQVIYLVHHYLIFLFFANFNVS